MPIATRNRRIAFVCVGIAIIVLPLVAIYSEPMLGAALIALAGIVILPAYIFIVVMAATGLFGSRAAFLHVASLRGPIVGVAHGLSVVCAAGALILGQALAVLFIPLTAAAIVLYLWLVAEWVLALRARGGPGLQARVTET